MVSKLEINWLACPDAEFSCAEIKALRVVEANVSAGDCKVEMVVDDPAPPVRVLESVVCDVEVCPSAEVAEVPEVGELNIDSICVRSCCRA